MFQLIQLTLAQKVVLMVSLPVTGMLLYLLLWRRDEDEDESPRDNIVTSRQTVIEVKIPRDLAGAIIGPQGSQIKQIQDESGARVNFKDEVDADSSERTVIIRGTHEGAQEAELMIRKVMADQPAIVTETMRVPQKSLGRIIGRNGDTVRTMSRQSKTKIIIERSEDREPDGMKEIVIKGAGPQVTFAKSMIEEKVEEDRAFRAKVALSAANRTKRPQRRSPELVSSTDEVVEPSEDLSRVSSRSQEPFDDDRLLPQTKDYLEVFVSAVEHPGHFWIQVVSHKSAGLDTLIEEMTRYYSDENVMQASQLEKPEKGDVVAALFIHDKGWYRARVLDVQEDAVDLYFLDFGDSEIVPKENVMQLRTDFFSLPFQAFECSLAQVKPKDGAEEWSEDAIMAFEDLTYCAKWKVLMTKTHSYRQLSSSGETIPCLKIIDTNSSQDVDIAETLVSRGLADWDFYPEEGGGETCDLGDGEATSQVDPFKTSPPSSHAL